MTPRQRLLAAVRHTVPDRVPNGFEGFNREAFRLFQERTGASNFLEYFGADYRVPKAQDAQTVVRDTAVENPHRNPNEVYAKYHENLPTGCRITEWGVGMIPGSNVAFDHVVSPLKNVNTLEDIEQYPLADLDADYRWDGLREDNQRLQDEGYATTGWMEKTIFEIAWAIRGFEEFMMDMVMNPDWARCLSERIINLRCIEARKYAEAGVDIIQLGDDVGSQDRMTISPKVWREWCKPGLSRIIESAKQAKPDIIIFYHSDGYIEPIIDELIEIGVNILNPVQPECMDPVKLKQRYGANLCLWGTVGTQTTMPFGTPEEVRQTVKERIETLGRGGGLVLAPTHTIEEDVPWENLVAFFEALEEFGKYDS